MSSSDLPLQQLIFKQNNIDTNNSTPVIMKSTLASKIGQSLKAKIDAKHEVTTINNLFYQPTNL